MATESSVLRKYVKTEYTHTHRHNVPICTNDIVIDIIRYEISSTYSV